MRSVRVVFVLFFFCLVSRAIAVENKPNLIFILVDDQGYYDLGCYGGTEFDTPRIDRMAREGIRFTSPIIMPRRRYAARRERAFSPVAIRAESAWRHGSSVPTRAKESIPMS